MAEPPLQWFIVDYIASLNRQDWSALGRFVRDDARHNGRPFGLSGYRRMLEADFAAIPDLRFAIERLLVEAPYVRKPAPLRLHAEGRVPRPSRQRKARRVLRECVLRIPRRPHRRGLVDHRQGRDRGPALAGELRESGRIDSPRRRQSDTKDAVRDLCDLCAERSICSDRNLARDLLVERRRIETAPPTSPSGYMRKSSGAPIWSQRQLGVNLFVF